jgi:hypothetical protein
LNWLTRLGWYITILTIRIRRARPLRYYLKIELTFLVLPVCRKNFGLEALRISIDRAALLVGLVDLSVVVLYKSPARCGAMEALLRGLDRVLTVGRSVQTASGYDFRAASALRDPVPLEAGYFGAPESYDLNTVTEIKRTDTIPVRRGVRAVQMREGFRLDPSMLVVASTTLGSLSELVFPSQHFTHSYSGEQYKQMEVTYTGGDPVCVLRVGYVENLPDSPGIAYVCSFQLHGELEQQFNSIRCMAYSLCWSFQRNAETRQPSTPADVLARMRLLCGYLLATWGPDECKYSLDAADVRLWGCLRGIYSVGGGNFKQLFKAQSSRLEEFTAGKLKYLKDQMDKIVDAFSPWFITKWKDNTIIIEISPTKSYSLTYDVHVDRLHFSGMQPWIVYIVTSGTEKYTFHSIERMVSFVLARVKRLELCCRFQDMIQLYRPQKRFHFQIDGEGGVDGPVPDRSDEFQLSGPAVEDD